MRRLIVGLVSLALVSAFAGTGLAAAPAGVGEVPEAAPADELPNPLEDKRRDLRQEGLNLVLTGEAEPEERGPSTVVKVGETPGEAAQPRGADGITSDDQYVELARETTDRVFVVVAEFGDERHPDFPDRDTNPVTPGPVVFDGPLHNRIPEPDRTLDNRTIWQPDYDRDHYERLYFSDDPATESLKQYYERQSSGRYSIDGTATEWVRVRYNEARYGRSGDNPTDANGDDPNVCAGIVCANSWNLVDDAMDQWVADQEAAGLTRAQITADLRTFDVWDRYDFDADGNFNEADGYIDHLQVVHAGGDEAEGDPYQGEDAIWSHRWYAFTGDQGRTGPAGNLRGGAEIGGTGLWAGDYTVQPENGGLGVVAHEYGHDLGLPDHYDTAGGGDNAVNWWTLMGQSRVSAEGDLGVGTRAQDLSAWDKLQLGWLEHVVATAGQDRRVVLGPHEYNTANPQALVVVLPDKEVSTPLGAPYASASQYWSGSGDDLATTMTRTLDLESATATASIAFKARYELEAGVDYLYAQVSRDGGATWTALDGRADGRPFARDAGDTPAIGGTTGGRWVDVAVPLDALAGETVQFRFLHRTDGGVALAGFFADEIVVTADGRSVRPDGAEDAAGAWTLDGFRVAGASATALHPHYYIASNRQYVSYDTYLRSGPYHFGFTPQLLRRVEHFPYQDGLLVSYWDTSFRDNNASLHPGQGLVLPIDAHPEPLRNFSGGLWRGRIQTFDAPFSQADTDSFTLHVNGQPSVFAAQRGNPTFDDARQYWYPELPNVGVKTPGVGVGLRVLRERGTTMTVRLYPTSPRTGG